jgi:hypothetical protein
VKWLAGELLIRQVQVANDDPAPSCPVVLWLSSVPPGRTSRKMS